MLIVKPNMYQIIYEVLKYHYFAEFLNNEDKKRELYVHYPTPSQSLLN